MGNNLTVEVEIADLRAVLNTVAESDRQPDDETAASIAKLWDALDAAKETPSEP